MAGVFPSPLRRSRTGFQVPAIKSALDLAKIKSALDAVGKEAGGDAKKSAPAPRKDFTLRLF